MPRSLWLRVLLVVVAIVLGIAYIFVWLPGVPHAEKISGNAKSKRLTAVELASLAASSRAKQRWLTKNDASGETIESVAIDGEDVDFENLIRMLHPGDSVGDRAEWSPVYSIAFLAGNRGIVIGVNCTPDRSDGGLDFEIGGQFYSGGKSTDFARMADTLLSRKR